MTISGAITRWIDCLARPSCACRIVWSTAAMLPHQPCFGSGARRSVYPAGHGDAMCACHDHGVCRSFWYVATRYDGKQPVGATHASSLPPHSDTSRKCAPECCVNRGSCFRYFQIGCVASCGVRQPCCRTSLALGQACVVVCTLLGTEMLCVLVTIV